MKEIKITLTIQVPDEINISTSNQDIVHVFIPDKKEEEPATDKQKIFLDTRNQDTIGLTKSKAQTLIAEIIELERKQRNNKMKMPVLTDTPRYFHEDDIVTEPLPFPVKRKRGRPRKL